MHESEISFMKPTYESIICHLKDDCMMPYQRERERERERKKKRHIPEKLYINGSIKMSITKK